MSIKLIINKFFALITAITVVTASFSFTVNSHYCLGVLKDRSINSNAETCFSKRSSVVENSCKDKRHDDHDHLLSEFQKLMETRGCCDDSQVVVTNDLDYFHVKTQINKLEVDFNFLIAFVATHYGYYAFDNVRIPHLNYKPPLLHKDIIVLVQSFLC